ncbi:hypothetical protein Tco_1078194 [Tanacetum coccineum]
MHNPYAPNEIYASPIEILYGDVDEDGRAHVVARGELRAAFDAPAMARILEVSRIYPQFVISIFSYLFNLSINNARLIDAGFEPCKPFENHESHGDIPFSGPLQVSGSSGFAWARRRFDDSSSLRSCSRGRDSKPEAFDSGSDGHNSQDRSIAVFKENRLCARLFSTAMTHGTPDSLETHKIENDSCKSSFCSCLLKTSLFGIRDHVD